MQIKSLLLFQLIVLNVYAQNEQTVSPRNLIKEEKFVQINGIEQWITIKGDSTKPAVLFIHGGPGSPISPFDIAFKKWEEDFIIIQWDQRGTGKTYGRNAPEELTPAYLKSNPLTIEQMSSDGIAVTEYLIKHLGKQKIILFGTSWGSILGVEMARKKPELFYAYIGHSQMVNPINSNLYAYKKVSKLSEISRDTATINILKKIGNPPYKTARNAGQLMRIIKKYQQQRSVPAPDNWWETTTEYSSEKDFQNRSEGDDYSFVYFAGDEGLGISSMVANIDFMENAFIFQIPVYFIQGKEDIQTPIEINKKYYRKIIAPKKKFIELPKTDHGFNQSVVDTQFKIMTKYVKPLVQ